MRWICVTTLFIAVGLWALNWLTQRVVLLLVMVMLAGCGPSLRDVRTVAIDGIDYVAHTPGGEF